MPKSEDRSDWVAVAPDASSAPTTHQIRKTQTAYQFFQRDAAEEIRREYGKISDIAEYGRLVKSKWECLSDDRRAYYQDLHRQDASRFAQESHQADVAALARREKMRQEENALMNAEGEYGKRMTRRKFQKKQRAEDEDYVDSSEGSWDSQAESEEDSDAPKKKKKKKKAPPRQVSQKQMEYREKVRQEKQDKEAYIAGRQEDLRKERSSQAKRRLEYLLKQGGNIFSHFGNVKEDTARYGIKKADQGRDQSTPGVRRGEADDDQDEAALEEADEHEATYLSAQPTTLGFGKMREYQLEGLNWMIRLQENGVNGILADGKCRT